MKLSHEVGEPCPVILKAVDYFGDKDLAHAFILEKTCFPMCDETAMKQLDKFIHEHQTNPGGWVGVSWDEEDLSDSEEVD